MGDRAQTTEATPRFGSYGAAGATSLSLVFETLLLFWIVRHRLGLHVLPFGKTRA